MKYRRALYRLLSGVVCMVLSVAVHADSETEMGEFSGGANETWGGLTQAGLVVRTFEQPQLLDKGAVAQRRYVQYTPPGLQKNNRKRPLVIALPGANLSAELFREWDLGDRLERLADKEHFYLVYANAYGPGALELENPGNLKFVNGGYWRTCFGRPGSGAEFFTVDDVSYLREVIARVQQEGLAIDPDRIYLMGMSNGGEMAQRAAREMAGELAGVGAVMPVNAMPATVEFFTCAKTQQQPISMMFIYSPKDTLLHHLYGEAGFSYAEQMRDSITHWRNALGVPVASATMTTLANEVNEGEGYKGAAPWALASMNSRVTRYDYAPAPSGATFAVLEINSAAGHAWPNASPTPVDTAEVNHNGFKNQDIQAEAVLWEFLKKSKRIIGRAK